MVWKTPYSTTIPITMITRSAAKTPAISTLVRFMKINHPIPGSGTGRSEDHLRTDQTSPRSRPSGADTGKNIGERCRNIDAGHKSEFSKSHIFPGFYVDLRHRPKSVHNASGHWPDDRMYHDQDDRPFPNPHPTRIASGSSATPGIRSHRETTIW